MGALSDWCEPLLDAPRMREVDRWAIEQRGIPSLDLMERAGEGVAAAVQRHASDGRIVVVCGKGNNGGDGLVVARLLREAAREVTVVCLAAGDDLSPDARSNLERLPGEPPLDIEDGSGHVAIAAAEVVVDALLGTGFHGEPRGAVAEAIELVNAASGRVVSVDVPSGVDASTGVIAVAAVEAEETVTFHASKPGLWISPGKGHAGVVTKIDIGIPRGAPRATPFPLLSTPTPPPPPPPPPPPRDRHRPDRGRRAWRAAEQDSRVDEVHERARRGGGGISRLDGCACDDIACGDACRRRLCDGLRA
jgi:ADP-dependent NAD(P)H-hydrate dehydratase / NAD(P)H-hydrate epimerase